jgi:nucleoside phosphorylase
LTNQEIRKEEANQSGNHESRREDHFGRLFPGFLDCRFPRDYAMIAVTFALPQESSEFLRRLSDKSRLDRNGSRVIRGNIDDREIEVLHTGVGEKVCRARLGKFLHGQEFELLISSGFAGALDDQLEPGDLLLAENFSTVYPRKEGSSFSELQIWTGKLVTVPALIHSTEERSELAQASGAAAVDMETEFIARACAEHAIPLLSLRVITDTSRQVFPAPPNILFDVARQRTNPFKLAKFFVTHPTRVPSLVQFANRVAQARKTLADALVATLREL